MEDDSLSARSTLACGMHDAVDNEVWSSLGELMSGRDMDMGQAWIISANVFDFFSQ